KQDVAVGVEVTLAAAHPDAREDVVLIHYISIRDRIQTTPFKRRKEARKRTKADVDTGRNIFVPSQLNACEVGGDAGEGRQLNIRGCGGDCLRVGRIHIRQQKEQRTKREDVQVQFQMQIRSQEARDYRTLLWTRNSLDWMARPT